MSQPGGHGGARRRRPAAGGNATGGGRSGARGRKEQRDRGRERDRAEADRREPEREDAERGRPRPERSTGPEIPEEITSDDLDRDLRAELRTLPRPVQETVARHLVAAGELVEYAPDRALAHASAARRLAPRIGVVREAAGLTAYRAGEWQTAIGELRTYHRIAGRQPHLAVLADCERALGRPAQALELYQGAGRAGLTDEEATELLIVAAGARADRGQHEEAVRMLRTTATSAGRPAALTARLRYAYADALRASGDVAAARDWFARAAEVDEDMVTDAADRMLELDGVALAEQSDEEQPLADAYDLLVLDLDGVVLLGEEPVPAAVAALETLRRGGYAVVFATNNASRTAGEVAGVLTRGGIEADPGEVLTAAMVAADALARRFPPQAPVLVVGAGALIEEVRRVGLRPVDSAEDAPVAVVQGYGPQVSWAALAEATVAVRAGAVWVATNTDPTLPDPRGPLPGNGALVAAVRAAVGREPDLVVGKPQPEFFTAAARLFGARQPLVVGDRLGTDIEGAHRAGLDSLLVLTGVANEEQARSAPASQRPRFIGADLGAVLRPPTPLSE